MANGSWDIKNITSHLASVVGLSYCIDSEYNMVYYMPSGTKNFYVMNLNTLTVTSLQAAPWNIDSADYKSISDSIASNGNIYLYGTKVGGQTDFTGYASYTISDRSTGAGAWNLGVDLSSPGWTASPMIKGTYYYAADNVMFHFDTDGTNPDTATTTYVCTHNPFSNITTHISLGYKASYTSAGTNLYNPSVRCGNRVFFAYYTDKSKFISYNLQTRVASLTSASGVTDLTNKTLYSLGDKVYVTVGSVLHIYDTTNDTWSTDSIPNNTVDLIYTNSFNYQSSSYTIGGNLGGSNTAYLRSLSYYLVPPNNISYSTTPGVTGVQLTWTDNSDEETYYRIDRLDDLGSTVTFDNIPAPTGSVTGATGSYFDATADRANHSYTYTIRAKKVI